MAEEISATGMLSEAFSEPFVIRSGVRSGLKRELEWALRAHSQIAFPHSRTRSGKDRASSSSPLVWKKKKRKKKEKPERFDGQGGQSPIEPIVIDDEDGSEIEPSLEKRPRRATSSALEITSSLPSSSEIPIAIGEIGPPEGSRLDGVAAPEEQVDFFAKMTVSTEPEESAMPVENGSSLVCTDIVDVRDGPEVDDTVQQAKIKSEEPATPVEKPGPLVDAGILKNGPITGVPLAVDGQDESSRLQQLEPIKRFTRSSLKPKPEPGDSAGVAEKPVGLARSPLKIMTTISIEDQEGERTDATYVEYPTKWITRPAAKALLDAPAKKEETVDSVVLEYPAKRMTRLATQALRKTADAVRMEETDSRMDVYNGSSRKTLKKKELKMSKKIVLTKPPTNIRELFATGFLEGLPVMYINCPVKQIGLQGVIKNDGILCSCESCHGSKTVSAHQFELHAGSTKKHPSESIFLENGKSIHNVLEECANASLDMLEAVIQKAIRPLSLKEYFTCQKCMGQFHPSQALKFTLLCSCCLESKILQGTPSSLNNTCSCKRSLIPVLDSKCDNSVSKAVSSTEYIHGRLTKKDVGLHKLVFSSEVLPEGTVVAYYVKGKQLLEGYIKDGGIFCKCCNTVISPSQFESHAGRAKRRKPYHNIYTSNGVSLHELSVSISKGRKLLVSQNDDLCGICADGGNLLLCDLCPRAFHPDCVGLSRIPKGDWYCRYCCSMHQRENFVESNANAIAAGRVAGVDPIEQIFKRCIRVVQTEDEDAGGCVLCRCKDYTKSKFGLRTVMICDQCEKEYHVGCLKDHKIADLKELPEGQWFCSAECNRIYMALQDFIVHEPEPLLDLYMDLVRNKKLKNGIREDSCVDIRWRLLSGKASADIKPLLSKAVSILHESFDPIVDSITARDLIPAMVYGRNLRDQDYGGMYCAILTVGASVVSVGILRVLGCDVAELPLVATLREYQGLGYFRLLFSCIEKLLAILQVKHFVLPAADEAKSIWIDKFGFSRITSENLDEYTKGVHLTTFQGTSMMHKSVPQSPSD